MTTLTINKQALIHNINVVKKVSDQSVVIAVLKGNGYGLGLVNFASLLEQQGIHYFAVTDLEDAVTLRENNIHGEILMLTPLYEKEELRTAICNQITLSITSRECGEAAEQAYADLISYNKELHRNGGQNNKRDRNPYFIPAVRAHLCIDTGFGRYGFLPDEKEEIVKTVQNLKHVEITGIFSHFSSSSCKKAGHVHKQYKIFVALCNSLEEEGIAVGMRHISSSSSLLRFPYTRLDAVRIGSAFLGRFAFPDDWGFVPIGTLDASIDDIYTLPAGHNVGYGNTYITTKTTTIAVVSAGYYHGLGIEKQTSPAPDAFTPLNILRAVRRHFTRKAITAGLGYHQFPIIGKIGMNSVVLDITGYSLSIGDRVTFAINPLHINSSVPRVYLERILAAVPCETKPEPADVPEPEPSAPFLIKNAISTKDCVNL
ncbi:MAG: alanine racemase [Clostridium sp.]|nr:alanine racemase [Clostridium sp.]